MPGPNDKQPTRPNDWNATLPQPLPATGDDEESDDSDLTDNPWAYVGAYAVGMPIAGTLAAKAMGIANEKR